MTRQYYAVKVWQLVLAYLSSVCTRDMHNYCIAGNFGKVFNLAICQYLNNVMTTCAHAHVNESSANSAKLDCLLATLV